MSQKKGFAAENKARAYLISQGLDWVESNYRCVCGEIDLIMRDKEFLVFVEVRARSSANFGGAVASVTAAKRRKLLKTAAHYLLSKKLYERQATRFDILSFEGVQPRIEWIKNAFGLDF